LFSGVTLYSTTPVRAYVSLDTIRNWEQGKRSPTGAAKALLKVLDKAPEAALAALH
jgi:putative transcriptional regulator